MAEGEKEPNNYRMNPEQLDALRSEVQTASPERQAKYDEVTERVSSAFVEIFGDYLSAEQRDYMINTPVIAVRADDLDSIQKVLDENDEEKSIPDSDSLNGIYYFEGNASSEEGIRTGQHYWNGRVVAVDDLVIKVGSDTLISEEEIKAQRDKLTSSGAREGSIEADELSLQFLATKSWAQDALHEKIHGILYERLPLPICEAAAYTYQRIIFENANWADNDNAPEAVEYFKQLIEEFGEDLHLYLFGNLPEDKKSEMKSQIDSRFTPEVIKRIFPHIKWVTTNASS